MNELENSRENPINSQTKQSAVRLSMRLANSANTRTDLSLHSDIATYSIHVNNDFNTTHSDDSASELELEVGERARAARPISIARDSEQILIMSSSTDACTCTCMKRNNCKALLKEENT